MEIVEVTLEFRQWPLYVHLKHVRTKHLAQRDNKYNNNKINTTVTQSTH